MSWFADFINAEIHRRGGDRGAATRLADLLGEHPSQIYKWQSGQDPRASTVEKVLRALGGDISRAFPGYEPAPTFVPEPTEIPSMSVVGAVNAGVVDFNDVDPDLMVPAHPSLWRGNKLWGKTQPVKDAYGKEYEIILLEVQGDSMSPQYPDGTIIACRAPINPKNLDRGTPVIFFQAESGFTFKLLHRSTDGGLIGHAINDLHDDIVFGRNPNVHIPYVVVGQIERNRKTTPFKPKAKDRAKLAGQPTRWPGVIKGVR